MNKQNVKKAYIGIGSNLGKRDENLRTALNMIGESTGKIESASSFYETEPWGFQTDKAFLNMVVMIETVLDPGDLLKSLLEIEKSMGRTRVNKKYSSRIIDIDILFYEDLIFEDWNLKIPHPLIHERRFTLIPLAEIAPDFIHPALKKSISSLLESCQDNSYVRKL